MWLVLWDHSLAFRYCDRHQWPSIILLPYLSDIDCIDIVQDKVQGIKHGPTLQLNECQCKCLADESLFKVRSVLQSKGFQNNLKLVHNIQSEVLSHLHATVTRVKILVESCCGNSSWFVQPWRRQTLQKMMLPWLLISINGHSCWTLQFRLLMEPSWQWRNYSRRKLNFLKKLLKTETWLLEETTQD